MPLWARLIVVIAGAKSLLGVIVYLTGAAPPAPAGAAPGWVYAVLAGVYALIGAALVIANRGDVRAEWLGGFFLLIGAPLAPAVNAVPSVVPTWITHLRPDAFLALFLWCFAHEFPSNIQGGVAKVVRVATLIALAAGAGCAAINLGAGIAIGRSDAPAAWMIRWIYSTPAGNLYWPVVFGMAVPAYPLLLIRGQAAKPDERRRVQRFLLAFLIGLAPFAIEVVLEELLPPYKTLVSSPAVKPWVAFALFTPLATLPLMTAYSVLFDAVVDVRIVLRSALQYALARYMILGVTVVPFAALASLVVRHRDEPLVALVNGPRPVLLGAAAALGLVVLSLRRRWLQAVDRRYFRDAYDAEQILTRFVGELPTQSSEVLVNRARQELERSLHTEAAFFLLNDAQTSLRDIGDRWTPLAVDTPLVGLILGDPRPMDVDLQPGSTLGRLSEHEREWLAQGPFALVAALHRPGGTLTGLVALTRKRSGLTYSQADRHLVTAVAAAAALALDNLRLRTPRLPPTESAARECLKCSRLNPPEAIACMCGGAVIEAAAPHILRGIFRLEQRIGSGGMGVVYRAVDLTLSRPVAVKTLPRVDADAATRLRREARAMAALSHPNLAVIYGLETWHGVPFLVEEYLGGGTLSHKLAGGPLSIDETIELGCTLATVLVELHAAGIVHCDIKPSNIGFTTVGVVKLLDFGLSRLLRGALAAPDAPTKTPLHDMISLSMSSAWRGTPHYMSPEAARGATPAPAFDLWSASVVLFEALTCQRPFDGKTTAEIFERLNGPRPDIRVLRSDCPERLAAFFDQAFATDPTRRPANASALAQVLASLRNTARLQ